MTRTHPISNRWRVVAPAVAAGAALTRCIPAGAQDGAQRPLVTDLMNHFGPMLSLVPASIADEANDAQILMYADIAAQLAAGGIDRIASVDDREGFTRWIHATYPVVIAEPFRSYAKVLTREMLGFDVTDLDQTLQAGLPPNIITLLRGRFDEDAVAAAWEQNGYNMLEIDGLRVASLFEDAQFDFENEISRIALAKMNNAAFLPDGTLAYAPTLQLLESIIETATGALGPTASVGTRRDVAALLASLDEPVVSAMLFAGTAISVAAQTPVELTADNPELLEEIESQLGDPEPMPPVALGMVGVTAGGPTVIYDEGDESLVEMPPATIVYRLLMAEAGTADAAATVVEARLASMQSVRTREPWSELFGSWDARPVSGGDVLALDLTPANGRPVSIWPQMLIMRDLLFLAW